MSCKFLSLLLCVILGCVTVHASPPWSNDGREDVGLSLVRKDERVSLVSTEYGEISAVHIGDGAWAPRYHLQFITLEPNALFLPVLLHADMVFYVHSGTGRLSWANEDERRHVKLKRGDVFRLRSGSIFFLQSNLETERQKLRIYAIFTNPLNNLHEPAMGAYSSIRDLVLGFDKKVLRAAFQVPEELIDELTSRKRQPAIVHASTTEKKEKSLWEIDSQFIEVILGRSGNMFDVNKKKSEAKAFNLFDQNPDFKNHYGQSLIVTRKNFPSLKRPNLSIFMVNLTAGSMMGPHWNPMASEVSIVLEHEGMIHIVGPRTKNGSGNNQSTRFHVGEGDVFVVPRFHPMAQMAFNNHSFAFMGFSSTTKKNHPQFVAGKASVLRTLEKRIVAASFGITNMSTFDRFLDHQGESVILECLSCAEEELRIFKEETERRKEEEKKRREEEAKRREEEARKEEEEARRREEERRRREEKEAERREKEVEAKEKEEKARKRREEEARREKEERRRREEEAARRQEDEEARKKEEQEQARRQEEEEEAQRRREEEGRREEEEAEREEEERRQQEEEEERQRREEEERTGRQEGEEEEEEKEARKREKEEARRRAEAARERREEAARREEEQARRQEEEAVRREEEEARRREEREEEATRREEQEEEETREGEGDGGSGGSGNERERAMRIKWKL